MKRDIQQFLELILNEMGITGVTPQVDVPEDVGHGDYASNAAMALFGNLKFKIQNSKFKNPRALAETIKENIEAYQKKSGETWLEKVEIAGPGFINFFVHQRKLITVVTQVLREKGGYGAARVSAHASKVSEVSEVSRVSKKDADTSTHRHVDRHTDASPKRIVVEFTDPNPFKEFHVGHLYSNTVGESLCRLLEAAGNTVRRVNYQGDVGMHVSKSLWGLKQVFEKEGMTIADLEKKPLNDRVRLLGKAYSIGATAYEDPSVSGDAAKEEMKNINYLVFIAAQEYLKETQGWEPQVDYQKYIKVDNNELKEIKELYEKGRAWSLEYFETIYRRLGTTFEGYYFESIVGEYGMKLVKDHIADGIFEESDGAVVYNGEKIGLHTRVFVNSLGLPTYEAKELGLAPKKYADWPYDLSIIVTGKEIIEYFKVLIAAMKAVNPTLGAITKHMAHGMVRLPEGKMSSRTGKVLLGEWLLEEVKQNVYTILKQSKTKYSKEDQDEIAEKAAVAAVKYSLLKVALPADIAFDLEKSVSFDGDSGPYLQYTYARCRSVLRKAQNTGDTRYDLPAGEAGIRDTENTSHVSRLTSGVSQHMPVASLNDEERQLARMIAYFPDVVADAAANYAPNSLCTYLFKLAAAFNTFYAHNSILGETENATMKRRNDETMKDKNTVTSTHRDADTTKLRLALTAATAQVIHNGLYLLGIETLERM